MHILIVGLGTIGEPLAKLLLEKRKELGIVEIIVHKNSPELAYRGMLTRFLHSGAKLAVYADRQEEFTQLLAPVGIVPQYRFEEALERADVVIDCTAEGIGRKLKEKYYQAYSGTAKRFIAQGSEIGFGKPYAFDINDAALRPESDQYIQVMNCNAHLILSVLKTITSNRGGYRAIRRARFNICRRASDISQTGSIVGVEAGRAGKSRFGSHQAENAALVLSTLGITDLDLHASAIKIASSFMHTTFFDITLHTPVTRDAVEKSFRENPLTAVTNWMTNNEVFSAGRDWGHFGRILNQAVVCLPSLEISPDGHEIYGIAFTPQDGNALLSSVAAVLFFRDPQTYHREVLRHFGPLLSLFEET